VSSKSQHQATGVPQILIGEDNPADVYLIRIALQEHGIGLPLQVAVEGGEVLRIIEQQELLAETELKLIILDLNLPRHGGLEILQRLRQSASLMSVPVAVLTSSDSPRDRLASTSLGAMRFLQKPSNLDQFLRLGAVFKELLAIAPAG
jgi:CheY-like chemotaxis protein